MQRATGFLMILTALLGSFAGSARAQSISVSPKMPYATVTKTVQFSATVTGLSSSTVNWYAGGVKGGNSTAGTIDSTGLYTAPSSMPGQNPVTVAAFSTVNSKISGSTYVNIQAAGPTITSVTPNPISVGTVNVVIKGATFVSGARVYMTYGTNSLIQLTTNSVTPDTINATGYLGSAPTATFCVRNPSSDYGNSIVVPVAKSGEVKTYSLTVSGGSGTGNYAAGTVVNVSATPFPGQIFTNWTGAVANPNVASTTFTMPNNSASITANYVSNGLYALTVVSGSGSGAYAPGTVVNIAANNPPQGQQFLSWTAGAVANANSVNTTVTMGSVPVTVTANYFTPVAPVPYPVSSHPRIWMTVNDLPKYQAWAANPANVIYQQGIKNLLNQSLAVYNGQFFPGGVQAAVWPDAGDVQGYQLPLTEHHALVLAFNSLIDPNTTNRRTYAQMARNLIMVAMNQAALGHAAGMPFRDPMFAVYNRANGSSEMWPLVVDWIYNAKDGQGNDILTAQDKATIRNVFMIWANDCLSASTTGGDHPSPIGVTNSSQLLPNGKPYRMAANNYYLGHARLLTMMGLVMDPQDDPAVNINAPAAQLGNSMRSYITDANGAWLYQEFAMFADPSMVATAYGAPNNGAGFGLASGGLPPEGMLYGHSYSFVLGQLLALQTSGFNNPAYSGPQIGLIGAPMWDRFAKGFMSSMVPAAQIDPNQSWLGPIFGFGSYGDLLRLWVTPDFMQPYALLSLLDGQNGKTSNLDYARWFVTNACEGGAAGLMTRITQPWYYSPTDAVLYFLLLDPSLVPAADPRPGFSNVFVDPAAGRIVAHSDWSPTGVMFDYRASWMSINHQLADAGQFELYRKGEWLTKEMSNYDNNAQGLTSVYHNTMTIQNWCANGTPNLQWYENNEWLNGSQWMLGLSAGDPVTATSKGQNYVYATSDLTKPYNHPNFWTPASGAVDVNQATRQILWLNNDYVVVYDRATTNHAGFKRFNLSTVTKPTVVGNVAQEVTASGQQLFVQTLLPANPTYTQFNGAVLMNPLAWGEPSRYIMQIEDATKPTDTRFLNVLQGADAGAPMVAASYLQSTSGTLYDGTVFGSDAVFFPVKSTVPFAGTTFNVATGVHNLYVTGLTAGGSYSVNIQTTASGTVITIAPAVSGTMADTAGLVKVTF